MQPLKARRHVYAIKHNRSKTHQRLETGGLDVRRLDEECSKKRDLYRTES